MPEHPPRNPRSVPPDSASHSLRHRAVFLDRDGTLMDEEDHCDHPSRVRAIPGAAQALSSLVAAGWAPILITNQSGIGRGYFTTADYEAVNAELFRQLGRSFPAYHCPDHPDAPTPLRKPGTGMVEEAIQTHALDPARSWFIGDKAVDIACGRAAGCRTILVRTGYGNQMPDCGADHVVTDVVAAVGVILAES